MSSFPACQVCQQKFSLKGPAPFLLPCLHSLCETCVTSADGGVISCSTCQRDVNLTETRLRKDMITAKEILHLTVQHNPELVLCTHEDDGNQAVCWCKECEDFLCEHCQNVHGSFKGTKQHIVYDVVELEVGNLIEDRYCKVHPKFIADTWDTHCCMLTCRKCRLGDHSGHKTVDVEEAAQTSKKAVSTLQEQIQPFVDKHEGNSVEATKDLEHSAKRRSILPEKISHTFHSLKTLIDQREVEVRIAHEQLQDAVERQLQDKKNSSDINRQRCQTTSDYISKTLKYSSMHDIVELRPLLDEKSKDCRGSTPSEDYKSLALPVFNTDGLTTIRSTLVKFGDITTDEDVLENKTEGHEGIHRLLKVNTILAMFIGTVVAAIILTTLFQQVTDCETQQVILIQKLRQIEGFVENLTMEHKNLAKEHDSLLMNILDKSHLLDHCETQQVILIQKLRQIEAFVENLTMEHKNLAKEHDSMLLNILDKSHLLDRPHVEFNRTRYNAGMVHINDEGELINTPHPNPPHSDRRLKKYIGTSSTVPLTRSGSPQYWEVKIQVGIIKRLRESNLLLEIGLAREEEQDQHHCLDKQLHSYSLTVSRCPEHSSICRSVGRHGCILLSLPDTLENTPGTSVTLHYGVVYDSSRRRIAFLDLERGIAIGKIDYVDSSVVLWPMFGVYNPHWVTIRMSLVVGHDIDMTEDKKALILESFTLK